MQPVVLENERFDRKLLQWASISVYNISDVRNVPQNNIFKWYSTITKLLTKTLMKKFQPVVSKRTEIEYKYIS